MAEENKELEQLKNDLGNSKAKCEEYLNGWKRERADFLNYKKSEMERISELAKYAKENKMEIQDVIDKKQVMLFGRSFGQWQVIDGKVVWTVQDPEDILVSGGEFIWENIRGIKDPNMVQPLQTLCATSILLQNTGFREFWSKVGTKDGMAIGLEMAIFSNLLNHIPISILKK